MKHNPYEQMKEAHFHTDSTTWYRCKDLQAEIDCLKAQLAERDEEIDRLRLIEALYKAIINNTHIAEDERIEKIAQLTEQLAARQQEVEAIRKATAREILEDAKMLLHYTECYAMNYKTSGAEQVAKEFRNKFGLEG